MFRRSALPLALFGAASAALALTGATEAAEPGATPARYTLDARVVAAKLQPEARHRSDGQPRESRYALDARIAPMVQGPGASRFAIQATSKESKATCGTAADTLFANGFE